MIAKNNSNMLNAIIRYAAAEFLILSWGVTLTFTLLGV